MQDKESKYIFNAFKLVAIVIIGFCVGVIWLLVGDSGCYGLLLLAEVPSMYISLISATMILGVEFAVWCLEPRIRNKLLKK